jgi:hypothetical protein
MVYKPARLVAIGNLKKKTFISVKQGDLFNKTTVENPLGIIWDLIILEVYQMYLDVRELVGSDFIAWYTDCIYVSRDHSKALKAYFDSKELTIKSEPIKLKDEGINHVTFYSYKKERDSIWRFSIRR